MSELWRRLELSLAGVSQSVKRSAQIPARFSGSADSWRNARPGDQRAGHGAGQGEKALSGGMGAGGKRPRGLWALALCCGKSAGRDSGYSDQE